MLINGIEMTKAQVRVEVAKDVIRSLKLLNPKSGVYLRPFGTATLANKIVESSKDSRKVAQKLKKGCEVCALGACFLSTVKLTNKYTFNPIRPSEYMPYKSDSWDREDLLGKLHKVFTPFQIDLIETAFEGYNCGVIRMGSAIDQRATSFYHDYEDETSRLRAIMKNIIRNNGTFKP